LIQHCFESELKSFRFDSSRDAPKLFTKLPLEISLLALLVEAYSQNPPDTPDNAHRVYVRNAIRGQNLDRAGLSSLDMKIMNLVSQPVSLEQLSQQSGIDKNDLRGVLRGFELAELIRCEDRNNQRNVVVVTRDPQRTRQLNEFLAAEPQSLSGKVVRDLLAVKLIMRRNRPDALLVDLGREDADQFVQKLFAELESQLGGTDVIGLVDSSTQCPHVSEKLNSIAQWPERLEHLQQMLELENRSADPTAETPARHLQTADEQA
jgi:hypothetical protein